MVRQVEGVTHSAPSNMVLCFTEATNILYTFGGYVVTLEIMHAMWKPKKFKSLYLLANLYVFTFDASIFYCLYWAFRDQLLSQSTAFSLLPKNAFRDDSNILMLNHQSCKIPEAMLPEPFSQKYHTLLPKPLPVNSSIESHPSPIEYESMVSSPSGQSIKKYFSHKMIVSETEKTQLLASLVSPISVENDLKMRFSPQKDCSLVFVSAFSNPPTTPISGPPCSNSSAVKILPVELAPIPRTVTVETLMQPAPAKRVSDLSSCEKMNSEARIPSPMATKRSLTFDMSEEYIDSNHQTAETKSILAGDYVPPTGPGQDTGSTADEVNEEANTRDR